MVRYRYYFSALIIGAVMIGAAFVGGAVRADQYDQQIAALQAKNASDQAQTDSLGITATNYQQAIDVLSSKINSLQISIVNTQSKIDDLQTQINQAEAQIKQEKVVLGDNIRTMYLEGNISTLEILASSKNLSDFVNKQQYRNSVADKLKTTLDAVNALKVQLADDQDQQKIQLASLQKQQNDLQSQENQKSQLLNDTESQISSYNQQISSNNAQIASLRAQQAAAMEARFGGGPAGSGVTCGGGYPAVWCEAPQDSEIDSWGMFNRECVSYAAWAMAVKYHHNDVPYGMGNANQWPAAAASYGIPEGSTPQVGSVAIWYVGAYGHAMVVDAVYSDGSFLVSQYNYDFNGLYSTMVVPANSGFTFIYF